MYKWEIYKLYTEAERKLEAITRTVGLWAGYQYEANPELRIEIQQLTSEIMTILSDTKRITK